MTTKRTKRVSTYERAERVRDKVLDQAFRELADISAYLGPDGFMGREQRDAAKDVLRAYLYIAAHMAIVAEMRRKARATKPKRAPRLAKGGRR